PCRPVAFVLLVSPLSPLLLPSPRPGPVRCGAGRSRRFPGGREAMGPCQEADGPAGVWSVVIRLGSDATSIPLDRASTVRGGAGGSDGLARLRMTRNDTTWSPRQHEG